VHEFFDAAFDANGFNASRAQSESGLSRNQWPRSRAAARDRTFYFVAFEGLREQSRTFPGRSDHLERTGDSQSFDAAGRLLVIYDPRDTARSEPSSGSTAHVRDPFPETAFRRSCSTRSAGTFWRSIRSRTSRATA
jgi:hypothetical protein